MSINKRSHLRKRWFIYSVIYTALSRQTGKTRTIVSAVTEMEPTINGRKPNFPCCGCQADENNRSLMGIVVRIGKAFIRMMASIRKAIPYNKKMENRITVPAAAFLILL